ncbi:MAG: maltodextrin phosphorylase [Planctomycetaceae bacterium]|nr:maltodextrin phosphorylase [Planctomycetaceae bacterium]
MTLMSMHEKLWEMANNLWWSWHPEVNNLFAEIDPIRWSQLDHNPVLLLREFQPEQLEKRAKELVLHSRVNWAYRRWQEYMASTKTWGGTHAGVLGQRPVAYFSAEFGLHESLPIYSGGLGILAGDHLKSASDLGIPLVAVGLFYTQGYFKQSLSPDGWQQEAYTQVEIPTLPLEAAHDKQGQELRISVSTRGGTIYARVWRVNVGRVRLYLLDANVPENSDEDRHLTARLYGGDQRTRIRQEVLLGIGGVRALAALGIQPAVIHMNEGHSAFAGLEVIRARIKEDEVKFDDALRDAANGCVFTTHTPVPAGHDRFNNDLIEEHLGPMRDELQLSHDALMSLGRVQPQDHGEAFCMTVLAFKLSRRANAVSALHGIVSRRMWASLWPWRSDDEIPIGHITNGVHVPTWLAPQMRMLYDRVLPSNWSQRTSDPQMWADFDSVSPGELWETHTTLKNGLITYVRSRQAIVARKNNLPEHVVEELGNVLDPRVLTIGFARRFAPYKRAGLILNKLELLSELINDPERPIQLVFSGKAHPADEPGKRILQEIIHISRDSRFKGKIVFLENYDISRARHLVQGVDVWLNNPRRPLEASGTSGQKVVLNGGLNCSILDGWWAEAYDGSNGFAIGTGRTHVNSDIQDRRDADDLYRVLKEEVIPLYYDRDRDDLPQAWIKRMKRTITTLGWRFNADRMVMDYVRETYVPAAGGLSCETKVR